MNFKTKIPTWPACLPFEKKYLLKKCESFLSKIT